MKTNITISNQDISKRLACVTGKSPARIVYNHIGHPRYPGAGLGVCPPDLLPSTYKRLPNTENRYSDDWGTYWHEDTASFYCYVPKHWVLCSSGVLDIQPVAQSGYYVDRAFFDGGVERDGILIAKYPMSIVGSKMVSRPGIYPFLSQINPQGFSGTSTPLSLPLNLKTGFRSSSTMLNMVPMSLFVHSMLQRLMMYISNFYSDPGIVGHVRPEFSGYTKPPRNFPESLNNEILDGYLDESESCFRNGTLKSGTYGMISHNGMTNGIQFCPQLPTLLPGFVRSTGAVYLMKTGVTLDSATMGFLSLASYDIQSGFPDPSKKFYSQQYFPEDFTLTDRNKLYAGIPALEDLIKPTSEQTNLGIPVWNFSLPIGTDGVPVSNTTNHGYRLVNPAVEGAYTIRLMEYV